MKIKELIDLLKSVPYQDATITIGFDSNLGHTTPNGKYEIVKYDDGVDVFLFSDC